MPAYVPFNATLLEPLQPAHAQFLQALSEQAVRSGIDYATLGQGWNHPKTRLAYRQADGDSFRRSTARQQSSRETIEALAATLAAFLSSSSAETQLVGVFCAEIGRPELAANATFAGVRAALEAELLLPLRSLAEGVTSMTKTFNGAPVPRAPVQACVDSILAAVLAGQFDRWRYENAVGRAQLAGLSDVQVATWREPTSLSWGSTLRTHEDAAGELGFFWATKIGGPSHGFDVEGQCLLPLLANARHKVILVSDEAWPHHPAGRAHFRLLWVHNSQPPRALLWLETVICDFAASGKVNSRAWQRPVLRHALGKAKAMGVGLSVDTWLQGELQEATSAEEAGGTVSSSSDALVLRPSNGVVEASDYLTRKHDWVQLEEEVTGPLRRVVWWPSSAEPGRVEL